MSISPIILIHFSSQVKFLHFEKLIGKIEQIINK